MGVIYYLGAELAFLIGTLTDKIFAPFWSPNAILFCALALVPYRRWPHYIIAVVPAHIMAELSVGMGWLQMFVAFATNIMVALSNAFGLRYLLGPPPWLNSLQRAVGYVFITAVGGPALWRWAARLCASLAGPRSAIIGSFGRNGTSPMRSPALRSAQCC